MLDRYLFRTLKIYFILFLNKNMKTSLKHDLTLFSLFSSELSDYICKCAKKIADVVISLKLINFSARP